MTCQCYKVGGPFITYDPECYEHGDDARKREDKYEEMQRELVAWRKRFPYYKYRAQDDVLCGP